MAIKHMQAYLKSETTEQKKARIEKRKATMAAKRLALGDTNGKSNAHEGQAASRVEFVGIRVNISTISNGQYLKGTSKTILLTRKAFSGSTDELREHLTAFLRTIKKERAGKSVVTI